MKPDINNYDDVLHLLDDYVEQIQWNPFYKERNRPAPFILQNGMPDENLVEFINKEKVTTALELGCGEGRNAIFMAKQGISVTALDISSIAIENAKKAAIDNHVSIDFQCQDALNYQSNNQYDFIYDSGMFHHIAPHRRITYKELLKSLLSPKGYFGMTCFAWGDNEVHGADEVSDWEFYQVKKRAGVAFTPERLKELFEPQFNLISIRKMKDGVPDTIQGLTFMWTVLFQNNCVKCY